LDNSLRLGEKRVLLCVGERRCRICVPVQARTEVSNYEAAILGRSTSL